MRLELPNELACCSRREAGTESKHKQTYYFTHTPNWVKF